MSKKESNQDFIIGKCRDAKTIVTRISNTLLQQTNIHSAVASIAFDVIQLDKKIEEIMIAVKQTTKGE